MDAASRGLLEAWLDGVSRRPDHHCGVFTRDDGEPFGHRARPWDYPDILTGGGVDEDALLLELSEGPLRIESVDTVVPGSHAWGPGLLVSGMVDGTSADVWLV